MSDHSRIKRNIRKSLASELRAFKDPGVQDLPLKEILDSLPDNLTAEETLSLLKAAINYTIEQCAQHTEGTNS